MTATRQRGAGQRNQSRTRSRPRRSGEEATAPRQNPETAPLFASACTAWVDQRNCRNCMRFRQGANAGTRNERLAQRDRPLCFVEMPQKGNFRGHPPPIVTSIIVLLGKVGYHKHLDLILLWVLYQTKHWNKQNDEQGRKNPKEN